MHITIRYFIDVCYDVTYFWLLVEFCVLKWSLRPRVRAFHLPTGLPAWQMSVFRLLKGGFFVGRLFHTKFHPIGGGVSCGPKNCKFYEIWKWNPSEAYPLCDSYQIIIVCGQFHERFMFQFGRIRLRDSEIMGVYFPPISWWNHMSDLKNEDNTVRISSPRLW